MGRSSKLLLLPAFVLAMTLCSQAQVSNRDAEHAPDGGTTNHIDSIFVPAVPNAPFSAKVPVESSHTLPDGSVVTRKFYTLIARDSNGRVHNEDRKIIPGDATVDPPVLYYIFLDPQAQTRTFCYPAADVCRITRFHPVKAYTALPPGPLPNGNGFLQRMELGKDTMDSLDVIGTRDTVTFNVGAFGNDRPLVTTKEFWYSSHLQINLSVVRTDPRNGTQTLKVTELNLTEPDPALFQLPAGYKVEDERAHEHAQ